jgi:hypothetical protein
LVAESASTGHLQTPNQLCLQQAEAFHEIEHANSIGHVSSRLWHGRGLYGTMVGAK